MSPLRVLALDHYFDQDLQALEANQRLDVRRFPYQRLRGPALRFLGKEAGHGLRAYNNPDIAAARGRYAAWLARELRRLYLEAAFDVIVLPSDTFFYVRTLPAAAHQLGIPVVVVQKETTISRSTMETFSAEVGRQAPFLSDFMTVCSERQREFWVRAGADAERIAITGQPRFDVYASSPTARESSPKRVLYLTYALDAYVPGAGRGRGLHTWQPLRDATEAALVDSIRAGACEVVVKCHPQQDRRREVERLAHIAGAEWTHALTVADQDADTRELILESDVVVGFQTTALYEAVAARRSVIYAAWGEAYDSLRDGLIPFDEAPSGCLHHAASREDLTTLLTGDLPATSGGCAPWYEAALGSIDGHATDRVAERLATTAAAWAPTDERRALDRRRRSFAVGFLARSLAAEALWTAAIPAANVAGQQRRVAIRRRRAHQSRSIAVSALRKTPDPNA